ncbi:MAG: hypothetical protein A2X31_07920 [Elusimicrobia bacterium GWB2_63_22]|nr:MAG: hypothetical protein A2X31_07920 [Elusimicrobia bacterium GWB2_63_22]
MTDRRVTVTEDCVEPELVRPGEGGFRSAGPGPGRGFPPPEKPGLFTRLKMLVAAGVGLLALGLVMAGALLTSTVIGAILGIPLLLAGAALFFVLFKFLSFGSKNTFIFRRF